MSVGSHNPVGLLEILLNYARAFSIACSDLEFARGQIWAEIRVGNDKPVDPESDLGKAVISALAMTREICESIPSLNSVVFEIDRLHENFMKNTSSLLIQNDLKHLNHRIHDELRDHYYYAVTPRYAIMYADKAPFGEVVSSAFPSAIRDIQDSGKCLALGQGTATVFHLMRVMEVGLRVLGRELGIPYAPSWESYFKQLTNKIGEDYSKKTAAWRRRQPTFLEIQGDLVSIKTAWRNRTMHIERSYDSDEANAIYETVKTFMQRMAKAKFKERGRLIAISVALADPEKPLSTKA